ncbi:MAG: hypothetical protein ABIT68_05865 [Sphingomicrobium sp.]
MALIMLKPDTLDTENRRFEQAPLGAPVFLNSLPKSGSHLLRNIVRMFVPVSQQYRRQFVQHRNLTDHLAAFDPRLPLLSWGHLPFSDAAAAATRGARRVLLVRDPYSWVTARARFFVSNEVQGKDYELLKSGNISVIELLNLMIFGIQGHAPGLLEMYTHHVVAWLGTNVHLLRFEELKSHVRDIESATADEYFSALFAACAIDRPSNWRERLTIGANPAQSGTARENLSNEGFDFPDDLPATQRALIDFAAPGLRAILGYE